MPDTALLIGLDVGGSSTHLRGEYLHTGASAPPSRRRSIEDHGPGANPNRVGPTTAARTLVTLVTNALPADADTLPLFLCAGVSGAGRVEEQDALTDALRTALEDAGCRPSVEVVHDGCIALDAAYGPESGAIVIAGTGSLVLARARDGTLHRAGGWGPLLGDAGSGHALGRAGLRAVAAAFDGGPATSLRARLQAAADIPDREALLHAVYQETIDIASVAPMVVEAAQNDDAVAARVLADTTAALAEQVGWLADRDFAIVPRLALLGGLVQDDHYTRVLREALQEHVPTWSIEPLGTAPVVGALRRAHRLAADAGFSS